MDHILSNISPKFKFPDGDSNQFLENSSNFFWNFNFHFWITHPFEFHDWPFSLNIISGHEPDQFLENSSIFGKTSGWVFQKWVMSHSWLRPRKFANKGYIGIVQFKNEIIAEKLLQNNYFRWKMAFPNQNMKSVLGSLYSTSNLNVGNQIKILLII